MWFRDRHQQQTRSLTPYDAFRRIQQLDTVIERELYLARKLFAKEEVEQKWEARKRLAKVSKLENERRELQKLLTMPKFPALPDTTGQCDAELANLEGMRLTEGLEKANNVLERIEEDLSHEYNQLRISFATDRERSQIHLDAISDLECRQFEARHQEQQIQKLLQRKQCVKVQRHQVWLENYCSGLSYRAKLFITLCIPRVLRLRQSSLSILPSEIIRCLDDFLFSAAERSATSGTRRHQSSSSNIAS